MEIQSAGSPFEYIDEEGHIQSADQSGLGSISFAPRPFSRGGFREAYKGTVQKISCIPRDGAWMWCWRPNQGTNTASCVVKRFHRRPAMEAEQWTLDLRALQRAGELAMQFNDLPELPVKILFTQAYLYKVDSSGSVEHVEVARTVPAAKGAAVGALALGSTVGAVGAGSGFLAGGALLGIVGFVVGGPIGGTLGTVIGGLVGGGTGGVVGGVTGSSLGIAAGGFVGAVSAPEQRHTEQSGHRVEEKVLVEPHLDGNFIKANSNNGWVTNFLYGVKDRDFDDVAQAFSHWTWTSTDGDLLVCDLQGVADAGQRQWVMTDPAIHSSERCFGHTDLGRRGMNAFFCNHRCNRFCSHLGRPPTIIDPFLPATRSSTYFRISAPMSLEAHDQAHFRRVNNHTHGGTCYAHASATVLRAAEGRIVGRRPESHDTFVQRIVGRHGTQGGQCQIVLQEECPRLRLRFNEVDIDRAQAALRCNRVVLLSFRLTDADWTRFSSFFLANPDGVSTYRFGVGNKGHAVVISGFEPGIWKIKNSWGDNWADNGYFKIATDSMATAHPKYYDVFFIESDLSEEDKQAFRNRPRDGLRTA